MRYVIRIVQWCRQRKGLWAQEPLGEELCERAFSLLKYLKHGAQWERGSGSALLKDMEDALQDRGARLEE
jgi:hypothetical protein